MFYIEFVVIIGRLWWSVLVVGFWVLAFGSNKRSKAMPGIRAVLWAFYACREPRSDFEWRGFRSRRCVFQIFVVGASVSVSLRRNSCWRVRQSRVLIASGRLLL